MSDTTDPREGTVPPEARLGGRASLITRLPSKGATRGTEARPHHRREVALNDKIRAVIYQRPDKWTFHVFLGERVIACGRYDGSTVLISSGAAPMGIFPLIEQCIQDW